MTNKTDKQNLDGLLAQVRLEQTIEDMQAKIEGRSQTTTQAAVDRAMARIQSSMERILSTDRPVSRIEQGPLKSGFFKHAVSTVENHIVKARAAGLRLLELSVSSGSVGAVAGTKVKRSFKKADPAPSKDVPDLKWAQGDLVCSLTGSGAPMVVYLELEGSFEGAPTKLLWVDPGVLHDQHAFEWQNPFEFPVHLDKGGRLKVSIGRATFNRQLEGMRTAYQNTPETDPALMLPIVVLE